MVSTSELSSQTLAGTSYLFVSAIRLSNLTQIPVEFPLHTLCGRIYPSALHLDRYNYLCWQLTGEGTFPKKEESAFLLFCWTFCSVLLFRWPGILEVIHSLPGTFKFAWHVFEASVQNNIRVVSAESYKDKDCIIVCNLPVRVLAGNFFWGIGRKEFVIGGDGLWSPIALLHIHYVVADSYIMVETSLPLWTHVSVTLTRLIIVLVKYDKK